MGKPSKTSPKANDGKRKTSDAAGAGLAAAALNPGTIAALMDIASRSGELSGLYAEKFRTGEAFQELDPQGVASQIQQLAGQAAIDPTPADQGAIRFCHGPRAALAALCHRHLLHRKA